MKREEFYKLTDILNSEVLGNFMHGGEADELIAMFEDSVEHSNILEQEEPVSEEFEQALAEKWKGYIDRGAATVDALEDNTQELAFAKGFYRGAKWQKNNLWKSADGDDLPEYEREVIALEGIIDPTATDCFGGYKVVFAHRPTPDGYDGKSITTEQVEHYTPKTYGEGGWNIPNLKYWLDVELPKEIEL